MKKFLRIGFMFLLVCSGIVAAQPSLQKMRTKLGPIPAGQPAVAKMTIEAPTQASVLFAGNTGTLVRQAEAAQWLTAQLELRQGIDALTEETNRTIQAGDLTITRLQQYYKGIKVEHGTISTTARNSRVTMMQLEFYSIADSFKINSVIGEQDALQKAMQFTQAAHFIWQGYAGSNPEFMQPRGELVIVRTYEDDSTVCLAWKFMIYADEPLRKELVYVHAQTGKIVLNDPIIKHANVSGTADTKYSGTQAIITDDGDTAQGKPYRLRQFRNGHNIQVLDYLRNNDNPKTNDTLAKDFNDNDNNWTAAEFANTNQDNAALDAMFNSQITSDYWKLVHNRNGWNNNNGNMIVYVHVNHNGVPMDNAYWNGSTLHLGDGAPGVAGGNPPATSLDDIGHELGHGITEATCKLIYRWESGAMNEGFSDIWAACITNYAKLNNGSLSDERTWRLFEKSCNVGTTEPGLRDMKNPELKFQPGTYKGQYWQLATYETCPTLSYNDNCGVHNNSGVLNKWFYILTQGDTSSNYFSYAYSVAGIGFAKSEKIAYLTSLNLTPNAGYSNCRTVAVNAATTLYGAASTEVQAVKNAWLAVGVDTTVWSMSNVPVFTTDSFNSIALGKGNYVWAGTASNGLYVFNRTTWFKKPTWHIHDIKADKNGGIWVAQSGLVPEGGFNLYGGVDYFADSATGAAQTAVYSTSYYNENNAPTNNVRSLFIDSTRVYGGSNPRIWIATGVTSASQLNGTTINGRLGEGLYADTPFMRQVATGINVTSNTPLGCNVIGGNKDKVWTFVAGNYGKNQILSYNAATKAFLTAYDNSTVPLIPVNINVQAIYTDMYKRTWFGLAGNAVLVYDEHQQWHYLNFPAIFSGHVNANAITGSKYGDVYIGTSTGIVFFDHGIGEIARIDNPLFYKLYTTANGLPSNNVTGIAYDAKRFKVWVATSNGIVKWDPLCIGSNCAVTIGYKTTLTSLGPGNWSNPAIWEDGQIPDSNTVVRIEHDITVDIDAGCFSLSVAPNASIHVNAGKQLIIYKKADEPIFGRNKRGRNK